MAEAYMKPPKYDPAETSNDENPPETTTTGEKAAETSTDGGEPPLINLNGDGAQTASTNGEAAAEEKDAEAPESAEKDELKEEKPVDEPAGEGGGAGTSGTAADETTTKNALEAPLPPEFTTGELIEKRKVERGYCYACCFALCCCPLCYESYEYILENLCCQKRE